MSYLYGYLYYSKKERITLTKKRGEEHEKKKVIEFGSSMCNCS